MLTGNLVYEPSLIKKATKYCSKVSRVSKLLENIHMSGIMLNFRTQ
jgi:hypothetical protein